MIDLSIVRDIITSPELKKMLMGVGITLTNTVIEQIVLKSIAVLGKNNNGDISEKSDDELKMLIEKSITQILTEEFKEELAGLKEEDIRNIVDAELKKVEYKMGYENRLTIRYEAQYAAEVTAMLKAIDTSDLDEDDIIEAISIKISRELTEEEQEEFHDTERLENVDSPFNFEVDGFYLIGADVIFTTCLEHNIDMHHVAEYAVYMDRHLRDISPSLYVEAIKL